MATSRSTVDTAGGQGGRADSAIAGAGLFIRKSSGLVRELGLRDALAINLSGISLGAVVVAFGASLAFFPNADLTIPIIVSLLLMLPISFVYSQLTAAIPRSGGDYVFVGRILHPALGAAVGFALLLNLAYGAGFTATWFGAIYGPASFQALGSALGIPAISDASSWISTQAGQFWTGLPLILIAGIVGLRGARALATAQILCVVLGSVAVVVLVLTYFTHSNAQFQAAFNAAASQPGAYQAVMDAAQKGGWPLGATTSGIVGVLPFAMMLYLGFTYTVYPAGEVKRAGQTVHFSLLAALGISFVVFMLSWIGLVNMVGLNFAQAAFWLNANDPATAGSLTSIPLTPNGFAYLMMGDPVSKILLALLPLWGLGVEFVGVLLVSRVLFALSFDRLLPTAITRVTAGSHSPVIAVSIAVILMIIAMASGIYTGIGTAFRNSILIFLGWMLLSSIAGTLLPWLKKDLYAAAPKPYGQSWFGVPPVTVVGVLSIIAIGGLFFLAATRPQLSGGYDPVSITTLLIASFGGLIAYGISTVVLRSRGTDLAMAMRELPPD